MILAKSLLLAKFACGNLAVKFSDVNLLNSLAVMYLLWSWSVIVLYLISPIFVLVQDFLLNYFFSTAVRAIAVTKLMTLGILFLTSFILALRVVLVAKLIISDILSSIVLYLSIICIIIFYYIT